MEEVYRKRFKRFHMISRETRYIELHVFISSPSWNKTHWKVCKSLQNILSYNSKKKWARDLIKILEGRLDRVMAN